MSDFNDVVYSTRIRLARNVKGLPFPKRLHGEEQIFGVLYKGVKDACDSLFQSEFYQMSKIDALEAKVLVEKHLISPQLAMDCPYGAAIIAKDETVSIMLNEEDHIREQCIVGGFDLEQAYRKIEKVDRAIAQRIPIAYDKELGYLTACPTNLGAAMRASVMLFLPALTMSGLINSFIHKYQDSDITTRGVYGEGSEADGYLYQVSNQAAIGLSEREILDRMTIVVKKLIEAERIARKNLAKNGGIDFKDKVMRAYGILMYSCKISSKELMQSLALVKLGVSLGYLEKDTEKIDRLIVMSQPAMLCKLAGKNISAKERDIMRSAMVKKILE